MFFCVCLCTLTCHKASARTERNLEDFLALFIGTDPAVDPDRYSNLPKATHRSGLVLEPKLEPYFLFADPLPFPLHMKMCVVLAVLQNSPLFT